MVLSGSLLSGINWGSVPEWLTLATAIITIVATAHHFNKQPKEEIHPMITVKKSNDSSKDSDILFWAVNKSNIPVSLAFQGVKLAKSRKQQYDRLGNEFVYDYLGVNKTTRLYSCKISNLREVFPTAVNNNDKIVFGFVNELNQIELSAEIDINTLESQLN